jgi:cytosine/adenosine deaminase-related metal-dependent hydrolase
VLPYAIADIAEFLGNAGALSAATCHAAAACNLADRKARLAPGFDADILAVEGNPLTDINAIRRRVALFHRGRLPPAADRARLAGHTRVPLQNRTICTGQQARFIKHTGARNRRSDFLPER